MTQRIPITIDGKFYSIEPGHTTLAEIINWTGIDPETTELTLVTPDKVYDSSVSFDVKAGDTFVTTVKEQGPAGDRLSAAKAAQIKAQGVYSQSATRANKDALDRANEELKQAQAGVDKSGPGNIPAAEKALKDAQDTLSRANATQAQAPSPANAQAVRTAQDAVTAAQSNLDAARRAEPVLA